jgi:hypothetical protein
MFMAPLIAPIANAKPGITILDITVAASQYELKPGDHGYNATIVAKYDISDPGGPINMIDLVTLAGNYTGT